VNPPVIHVASGREWRGGQRQVWLLAQQLKRLGLQQVVVTGSTTELARRLRSSGIPVRTPAWKAGVDPRVLPAILSELRRRPAVLHAHDAHALTLAGICSWLRRSPLVVTRRVDFPLRHGGFWTRADRVIAISHAVADVLVQSGVNRKRISVIHSGISLEETTKATPLGVRALLGLAPGTRLAANVAALVPHKDHATLLNAASHLAQRHPELHWVIAGEGGLRPALEAQILQLGLEGRVHLMGHVVSPERLIVEADVFVMSSRQEGLGTSVLEAMALGIPVASTTAGGLPEMLGAGSGLLVPPSDPRALSDAVARILENVEVGAGLAEKARSSVLEFSDLRMAEEVRSVYRSCVHSLDGS
jgi:glycosyltransferase involved in cell wall biosynthesis